MFLDDLDSWLVGCLLDGMVTCTWILIEFVLVLIPEINQNINVDDLKSIQNLTLDDKLGPSYGNFGSLCGCQVGTKLWQFWKLMWPEIAAASPPHHGFAIFRVF